MAEHRYWNSTSGERRVTFDDLYNTAINENHDYRPSFRFFGDVNLRHYGIELEMNSTLPETNGSARTLLAGVNEDMRQFYCKRDGSLRHGFEFNSMPMTLDYFKQFEVGYMNDLFANANVFASEDCGFHIHASRADLDSATIERIYGSMLNMNLLLMSMSKRKVGRSFNRYASFVPNGRRDSFSPAELLIDVNTSNVKSLTKVNRYSKMFSSNEIGRMYSMLEESGRYSALNITGENTIEFRFLGGTTDWAYVLDCLEFIDDLINLCKTGYIAGNPLDYINSTLNDSVRGFMVRAHNEMLREMKFANKANDLGLLLDNNDSCDNMMADKAYRIKFSKLQKGDVCVPKLGTAWSQNSIDPRMCFAFAMELVSTSDDLVVLMQLNRNRGSLRQTISKERLKTDFIFIRNTKTFLLCNEKIDHVHTTRAVIERGLATIPNRVADNIQISFEGGSVRLETGNDVLYYNSIEAIPSPRLRERARVRLAENRRFSPTSNPYSNWGTSAPAPLRAVPRPRTNPLGDSLLAQAIALNEEERDDEEVEGRVVERVNRDYMNELINRSFSARQIPYDGEVAPLTIAQANYRIPACDPEYSTIEDPEVAQNLRDIHHYEQFDLNNCGSTIETCEAYIQLYRGRERNGFPIPMDYPRMEVIESVLRGYQTQRREHLASHYSTAPIPSADWFIDRGNGEDDFGL